MSELVLENNLNNTLINENEQTNFLQSTIGKAINSGLNIGIRYLLPDIIEDEVIDIKDSIIQNGFKEGVKTAIDSAVNLGKSALGIVTGNFENVEQMQDAIKTGGIIDSVSNVIDYAVNKIVDSDKISNTLGNTIKKGKDVILTNITKNIESEFENQVNNIEKLNKYEENWKDYFEKQDFDGMQKEYTKINNIMKDIAPIEKTIESARTIENLHNLIKNNGQDFNLSEEAIELAKTI